MSQTNSAEPSGRTDCSSAWSFLWTDYADERYPEGDYDSKVFEGVSFLEACDAMVDWMDDECKAAEPVVDYEARADHIMDRYDAKDHATYFPRLDVLDHRIREYVR